ncbi:hypothetical protein [Bacillus sp. SD088]|uniref:hypothetical protein n=1 Tax=Bacillus sp. SD088 TaxID=2782012 RepID=UPI001A9641B6|nr:hypothetical protein [Bacillus sp. SD088]MBO0995632.1 hypothetical protein [Bacillus sp. SD088]
MSSKSIDEFNADVLVGLRRLGRSSPEITLKHYAYLWSRNDEPLAEKMAGNIKFNFSKETYMDFNGNQDTRMELVPAKTLPYGRGVKLKAVVARV